LTPSLMMVRIVNRTGPESEEEIALFYYVTEVRLDGFSLLISNSHHGENHLKVQPTWRVHVEPYENEDAKKAGQQGP